MVLHILGDDGQIASGATGLKGKELLHEVYKQYKVLSVVLCALLLF